MSKRKYTPGTTVTVSSLPSGRDLPAELLGAEAIVVKMLSQGTTHMHTIDTIMSVGGRRRYVLIPGTCLRVSDGKTKRQAPVSRILNPVDPEREQLEWKEGLIQDELKAWPLGSMDPESSAYEEIWHKRLKLHAMRIKLMHQLYT